MTVFPVYAIKIYAWPIKIFITVKNSMNHIYCYKLNYICHVKKIMNVLFSSICINGTCQPEDYDNAKLKDNISLGIFVAFLFLMVLLLQLWFNHLDKKKK
ncbi:hypothetical protein H8356DRAFT_1698038 [Neocallimastix lanati (nom. inval.)]|nr:hypothetical protein H8356DRAFT_1698038 [Neocallimastix sp. JGI-2020a]